MTQDSKNIDDLRYALAINRGMQILDTKTKEGRAIASEFAALFTATANHAIAAPDALLYKLYETLFKDWRNNGGTLAPAAVSDSENRAKVAQILRKLLWDEESGLLNANNDVVTLSDEELAAILAEFYLNIVGMSPFAYGNHLTLELFLTVLFDQPSVKEVYPQGIDFRRLGSSEADLLHASDVSPDGLKNIFWGWPR